MMGEAARRSSRRSVLHNSSSRTLHGALPDPESGSIASTGNLATSNSADAWFDTKGSSKPQDEALAALRAENRLLRRQLEKHPELHRLTAENRLLREHFASLVQQKALSPQEPQWRKGHRHPQKSHTEAVHSGTSGGPAGVGSADPDNFLHRARSLTRTSKSSLNMRGSDASGGPTG